MSGPTPATVFGLIKSQLSFHPHPLTSSFEGQTVICTGGNAGLGKNAIQQMLRLKVGRVIMAVRTRSKGEAAKEELEEISGRKGVIEVWQVDLTSYASVIAFAERVKELDRLDAVIANAGIWPHEQAMAEGHEMTITTNVISTMLMAYLLLPKLRQTALEKKTTTRLTTVGTSLHKFATLKARKHGNSIFKALDAESISDNKSYDMRYNDSKLITHLATQMLARQHEQKFGNGVCVTVVNPGFCDTELKDYSAFADRLQKRMLARTADEGGIALVDAVALDKAPGRNGEYIDECRVKKSSPWLASEDGKKTADRVRTELEDILDTIVPGLTSTL